MPQYAWNKGQRGVYHCSEETKKKLSEAHKGAKNYFFGKHHTEETKNKMCMDRRGKPKPWMRGRPSPMKGKHHSIEAKRKISESRMDEKNGAWSGNNFSYGAVHKYVSRRLEKPKNCHNCGKITRLDCCFKDHTAGYNNFRHSRNITEWIWLCRKCHMGVDGRLKNLKKGVHMKCSICGKFIIANRYGRYHVGGGKVCG